MGNSLAINKKKASNPMSYENPWYYNGVIVDSEALDNYIGFVYNITNLTNNRKYIGKKLLKRTKTKVVKGKKKRTLIESDWKDYYGSNKELQADVEALGPYNFKREILRMCKTKGECNYHEAKLQFSLDVLGNKDYYNTWIMVKVHEKHLPS
jgi:Putative endonuclease segE, GIY-YIG domain